MAVTDPQRPARRSSRSWVAGGSALLGALLISATLSVGAATASSQSAGSVTAGSVAAGSVTAGSVAAPTRLAAFDSQLVALVNQARVARGLPAVKVAAGLTALSVWWSTKLATGRTGYQLQHNPNAWSMLPRYGAASRTSWGENVAKFSPSTVPARDIFNAYMNSPGHRANILGAGYRYIGMGTMAGSGGTFNTMTFTDKVDSVQIRSGTGTAKVVRGYLESFAVAGGLVRVAGWAFSAGSAANQSSQIHVIVTGTSGRQLTGAWTKRLRSDVNHKFGITGTHGFAFDVRLQKGRNTVCVYALGHGGLPTLQLTCRSVVRS